MKRLAIVVPYRDRAAHLECFTPHMRAYFSRDKADREISYRVLVIEQDSGSLFNRGALKNIGFVLAEPESDYTCFHDVDYLPIWADYSWAALPTPIVWYGAEAMIPNDLYRRVNGCSNSYWGWGYEDGDLRRRFLAAGVKLGRRQGTFQALDHINEGFRPDGIPTPIASVNRKLFESNADHDVADDGLAQLDYEILDRRAIPDAKPERSAVWEIVRVRVRLKPMLDQIRATSV